MTIDEAIKHAEEIAEEQNNLYKLCLPEYNCNGLKDCSALENGKDRGCLKCASEHEQLAEWLKELRVFKSRKGHGRLIDADVLWDLYHSNDYDFYEALDRAPTIIEADRSEKE